MSDDEKVRILEELLAETNSVKVEDLLARLGTKTSVSRAVFIARARGMKLESVRHEGRKVAEYIRII